MNELGLPIETVLAWFVSEPQQGFTRVNVPAQYSTAWKEILCDAVRRCYISDEDLSNRAAAANTARSEVLAAVLPDAGAVMSGDFGEIVSYIYLASREQGTVIIGPKRWRLKQDRTKPAPGSDIVQFVLPQWPNVSVDDRIICGEVKAKATASSFTPIANAIEGSLKDSTSRLSRTLVWLRERRLLQDFGAVTIDQLSRFINATDFPPYERQFHAIAVICSGLVANELATIVPGSIPQGCALAVISVPNLQNIYTTVYEAVHGSVVNGPTAESLA